MLKKMILLVLLLAGILNAANLNLNKNTYNPNEPIRVHFSGMTAKNKDWIGIYPVNKNNDWGNVKKWKWTGDKTAGDLVFQGLPAGTYDVRAFYNNSFHLEAHKQFTVGANNGGATTVTTNKNTYNQGETVTATFKNMLGDNKDWMGIYPAGSSNAWNNVVDWKWTEGKKQGSKSFHNLPAGNYEVRVFFRNTFKVEARHPFKINGNNGGAATVTTSKASYNHGETVTASFNHMLGNNKDWIAVYRAGTNNEWENVVQWAWTGGKKQGSKSFRNLPNGNYEVRVFFRNTFKVEARHAFKVTKGNNANDPQIIKIKNSYFANKTVSVKVANVPVIEGRRPWVGIYEKDEESTFEHLVYYQFTDQIKNNVLTLIKTTPQSQSALKGYKSINQNKVYELRMVALVNNEYVTYAREDITVKPIYKKNRILASFNTHYNYFTKQMAIRLKKDAHGYNDTYVLYDVQMHMQNAIIYADETANTYMIDRLLALVKLPLKKKYMTNGKWLNNTHSIVGIEVDLCIAQYYSLLTRTLSAAQRHNIETNLSQREINIIINHIDQWINQGMNKSRVQDRYLFFVQSAIQFADYAKRKDINIPNLDSWKNYTKKYMSSVINKKWENIPCKYNNIAYTCTALDRTGWAKFADHAYAGYGTEITKTSSDVDPNAMFNAQGIAKHPKKFLNKLAQDVSHARRYNWFFETIKRFGKNFGVSISDSRLQGWANNLAYRVSRGTKENPKFTIYSDGVDGWYRVNYSGRKSFGYIPGDMDIHFIASSYGMLGTYNPKIYTWMNMWVRLHPKKLTGYYGGYELSFRTSTEMNIKTDISGL